MRLLGDFRVTLGTKLLALLLGTALVPVALLAFLSLSALAAMGNLTAAEGSRALTEQGRSQLQQLSSETAARADLVFDSARADAAAISVFAAYLYDNPHLFQSDPYWNARDRLVRGADGQFSPVPEDRFGTFVPSWAPFNDALVDELNLIAHLDYLLEPLSRGSQSQAAAYVVLKNGAVRVFPRLDVINPTADPTRWSAFVEAGPAQNPSRAPVWTRPHLDTFGGQQAVLTIAVPIYSQGSEFRGVAAVDVPLSTIEQAVLGPAAGENGHAFLVDRAGRVIAANASTLFALGLPHPAPLADGGLDPELRLSRHTGLADALSALVAGTEGVSEIRLDREEFLVGHAPLPGTGWSLALLQPRAHVVQSAGEMVVKVESIQAEYFQYLQVLSALMLVGATVVAILAARAFSQPIRLLTQSTRRIASGDLSHRVPVTAGDEIGELATEFNLMARNLAELNAGLESKVTERTEQLLRRAEQLRMINRIGQQITSILALDELLPLVVRSLADAFRCYSVALFLREGETLRLRAITADAVSIPPLGMSWPRDSLIGWVAEHGELVLVNDVLLESRYRPAPGLEAAGSELVAPIVIGQATVGVLAVQHRRANAFDDDDPVILRSVADQIAIALENAHLFSESRDRATLAERNRLAREMHDGLAQQLFGIVLQLEASDQLFEMKPERAQIRLKKALDLARDALQEARRSVWNLRSAPLDGATLVEAIRSEVRRFQEETGAVVKFQSASDRRLPPETENCLYRICQEALNNVRKHARATNVVITLEARDDSVYLSVRDDGAGFDMEARTAGEKRSGFGLVGMVERAQMAGGQLSIRSRPGQGTEVAVSVPLSAKEVGWQIVSVS